MKDPNATIGPPAKRHLKAFRRRDDDGPTLNAGLVHCSFVSFTVRNPIFSCFYRGQDTLPPPPGSAHGKTLIK